MKEIIFRETEKQILSKFIVRVKELNLINSNLFIKHEVKRGLRNLNGVGVLVGLTSISEVLSKSISNGKEVNTPGRLFYRGMEINDLVDGFTSEDRYGFEEACYLLLFGTLPNSNELQEFQQLLNYYQKLPESFIMDNIIKTPSKNIMNALAKSVLALYSIDKNPDDTSIENVLKQCIKLISRFSTLAIYEFQAYSHFFNQKSLVIHSPKEGLSIAENILHMLRKNSTYTKLEAQVLDLILVIHAEHGGGNNSSFVTHVVTSSGSDTYSVIAASLGSLKGPLHGGANIKVVEMFEDIKKNVSDWNDNNEITAYLLKILNKEAFDQTGLIYGMGHPVYSISDPRSVLLKKHALKLAIEKGLEKEFNLYAKVESLAPKVIGKERKIYKGVSANVDFYSGFVYTSLNIPHQMFTPLFAISRIVGWSAHRIEEIVNADKIIRPAYKSIAQRNQYTPIDGR